MSDDAMTTEREQDRPARGGNAQTDETDGRSHLPQETPEEILRQRDEFREDLLRTRADFLNYQKRARAQADIDRQYAVSGLAGDLLNVIDNFERAIDAARATGAEAIVSGLEMVHKQLLDTLARHGVEPIEALGQPFDPNLHEALMQQPDPEQPEGTVVGEMNRGYRIHDRVLRPSKVAVSTRPQG